MLKHILVPLDGSPLAENALDTVKNILPPDGKITLLTAVDNLDELPTVQTASGDAVPLDQYLEHLALRMRLEGFEVDIQVQAGDAADVIVSAAQPSHVDMIAMSTHGRSNLEQLLAGSITHRVLSASLCPVLVIPPHVHERAPDPIPAEAPDLNPGLTLE